MNKLFLLMISLFLASFAVASSDVEKIHQEAVGIFQDANDRIEDPSSSELVDRAFLKYFKLSVNEPSHRAMINRVRKNIKSISSKVSRTKYEFNFKVKSLWCLANLIAIVPPPIDKVHLCPTFFKKLPKQQIGTLIHEWFHRWGDDKINYLHEKYCKEAVGLGPEELIRNSDQYMLFIYFIGTNGEALKCF